MRKAGGKRRRKKGIRNRICCIYNIYSRLAYYEEVMF